MVEHRSPKPRVAGSNPVSPAKIIMAVTFSKKPSVEAITDICAELLHLLQSDKKVLWLVSGGSCIPIQVEIMECLRATAAEKLHSLIIMPVDERYGPTGHADSNTAQMELAGFDPYDAQWYDVLGGLPLQETVVAYRQLSEDLFATVDAVAATLGMGPDGHTAGILPGSPAVTDMSASVVGYTWTDYIRLTLGMPLLLGIHKTYLLSYGNSKAAALKRFRSNKEPFEKLPVKLLYDLPDVTVYNDYITTSGE